MNVGRFHVARGEANPVRNEPDPNRHHTLLFMAIEHQGEPTSCRFAN